MVVEGVEEGTVDKVGRPDHGGGPNEEASGEAGKAVAGAESRDTQENLPCPSERLLIPHLLGDNDVGSVKGTTAVCGLPMTVDC